MTTALDADHCAMEILLNSDILLPGIPPVAALGSALRCAGARRPIGGGAVTSP